MSEPYHITIYEALLVERDRLQADVARLTGHVATLRAACAATLRDIDECGEETCWCMPAAPDGPGSACEACQMRAALAATDPAK